MFVVEEVWRCRRAGLAAVAVVGMSGFGSPSTRWSGEKMDYGLGILVLLQQARRVRTFPRKRTDRPSRDGNPVGVYMLGKLIISRVSRVDLKN